MNKWLYAAFIFLLVFNGCKKSDQTSEVRSYIVVFNQQLVKGLLVNDPDTTGIREALGKYAKSLLIQEDIGEEKYNGTFYISSEIAGFMVSLTMPEKDRLYKEEVIDSIEENYPINAGGG